MAATAEISFLNRDALPVCLTAENPYRLVSLWEIMNEFNLSAFSLLLSKVTTLETNAATTGRKHSNAISNEQLDGLALELAGEVIAFCQGTGTEQKAVFQSSSLAALGLKRMLELRPKMSLPALEVEFRHLHEAMLDDSHKYKFLYIGQDDLVSCFGNRWFSEEEMNAFSDAKEDMEQAGWCMLLELNTAAVFHLMRCAEWALRALAKKLKVQITHKRVFCPLEYGEWDNVITAINNKISDARKIARGPKKQAKLELYSEAAQHCTFMKDIWRNTVSHTRKPYNQSEARAAFDRVRDFMQFLARSMPKDEG